MEPLEPRRLFADVTAVIRNDTLVLTGTASADSLRIVGGTDFDAYIEGRDGTTINGEESHFLGTSGKALIIDCGEGNDVVEVTDSDYWSGLVSVLGGAGDDRVVLPPADFSAVRNIFFNGGDGDDALSVTDRRINGRFDFIGGAGRDRADLSNLTVAGRLTVFDRAGPMNLVATDVAVNKGITLDTGNSADRIHFTRVKTNGVFTAVTRGGGDVLYLVYRNRFGSRVIDLGGDPNDRYRVYP